MEPCQRNTGPRAGARRTREEVKRPGVRGATLLVSALLVALPASAADVTYGVALRTDARTRTPLPGDVGTTVTGDLELAPRADLSFLVDASTFSLQYAPSLVWREPQTGGRLLPLHRGRLAFGSVWPHTRLLVYQEGASGLADVGALRMPDGSLAGSVGEVPTLGAIPYVRSASMFNLDTQPDGRLSLGFTAGYLVSGSTEEQFQLRMPLQWGPTGSARARVAVARTDGLTTFAQVSSAQFQTGQEQFIAQLSEIWDRQLSRRATLNLGVGAGLTRELVTERQQFGTPGLYVDLLPIALASLAWNDRVENAPLRLNTSLRMSPFADRFTGNVYERLEARAQGDYRPHREWIVTAATGGALALNVAWSLRKPEAAGTGNGTNQAGDRLLFGEATVGWTPKAWLLLQASTRATWTEQPRLGNPGLLQWVGTLSVTVQQQDSLAW